MGTRAAFWLGDPRNKNEREWLGCVAWDGYPEGLPNLSETPPKTKEEFIEVINKIKRERDDFASPENGGWPFPWNNDIFLTDYTYAFFDNCLKVTCFHHGFVPILDYKIKSEDVSSEERDDPTLKNVSIDLEYDTQQPDSIMIFSVPKA